MAVSGHNAGSKWTGPSGNSCSQEVLA